MSAFEALIPNSISLSPDQTVKEALATLEERHIRKCPVVDADGHVVGMFGLHCLMEDLLPMAAQIEDGLEDLDFLVGGAPGAAKKIRKLGPQLVKQHMNCCTNIEERLLLPDTPLLEVIRRLSKYGSPLPVIDSKTKKFIGLVSEQSCLHRLHDILAEIEHEEKG